jgi:hypothetical protein
LRGSLVEARRAGMTAKVCMEGMNGFLC